MIVNKATLDAIATNFNLIFQQGLASKPNRLNEIATIVPATSDKADFPIAALGSDMREWLGDRVMTDLSAWDKSLPIKDFERSVSISKNAIADDRLGIYELSLIHI